MGDTQTEGNIMFEMGEYTEVELKAAGVALTKLELGTVNSIGGLKLQGDGWDSVARSIRGSAAEAFESGRLTTEDPLACAEELAEAEVPVMSARIVEEFNVVVGAWSHDEDVWGGGGDITDAMGRCLQESYTEAIKELFDYAQGWMDEQRDD